MPGELPQPDLIDQSGRMKRLIIALIIGASAAAIAYLIANGISKDDVKPADAYGTGGHNSRIAGFVFYMMAFTGGLAFSATLAFLNYREKLKWRENRVPKATVEKK
jgi:hypothetical protein